MFGSDILFPADTIQKYYAEFGLDVKVEINYSPYTCKFLQCIPIPVEIYGEREYVMVRSPGRAVLQLQNCPIWCKTNAERAMYIYQ